MEQSREQVNFAELDLDTLSDREVVETLERFFEVVVEEVREGVEAVGESARGFAELGEELATEEDREERASEEMRGLFAGQREPSSRSEAEEHKELVEAAIRETREGLEVLIEFGQELFSVLREILDEDEEEG